MAGAPFAKTKVPLTQAVLAGGTRWCYPDSSREAELPIDDSDMGCDCETHCTIREAWTRENKLIDIREPDAISDDGQEVYNLLAERGIDRVLIMGVHLNMCVLGRSFAIRELVHAGKDVVLIRDMTDTMYNHQRRPQVNHFQGTDLVIEHVEKYWCPTITSVDLGGRGSLPLSRRQAELTRAGSFAVRRRGSLLASRPGWTFSRTRP